jgi:hypothetical protein
LVRHAPRKPLAALNAPPSQAATRQFDAETAARQLAAAIRGLNEDRDRIAERLAAHRRPTAPISAAPFP